MTRSRVVFRADASHELGFGHVARLCALIEEVQAQGGVAIPLFGGDAPSVLSWAHDRDLAVEVGDWSPSQIVQVARAQHATAVVVDGHAVAAELVPKLLDNKIPTVLVDDDGKCALPVSAIVNHNFHAGALGATYPCAQRRLLGRRYLMLRRDIRRFTRGSCRPMAGARLRVVVTFGGSDPVDATSRALRLLPADRPLELVVIAGPGYRHDEALDAAIAIAVAAGHTVDLRRAPDDPGSLFVSADAAICSAGGTLGELAYLGCPAIAYAIVRDQLVPARQQVREGLISGGRNWNETDDDLLRADLLHFLLDDQVRKDQRLRALATADGDGTRRIVEEALEAALP
jgi:spore coat polysaccharide biosynthesis predicted glycosyltransferase SpsG